MTSIVGKTFIMPEKRGIGMVFQGYALFSHKNLYRHMEHDSAQIGFAKDTVYRFLNSATYNWRKFLLMLSSSIIKEQIAPLTSENREKEAIDKPISCKDGHRLVYTVYIAFFYIYKK